MTTQLRHFLYRRGDGNEGNFIRAALPYNLRKAWDRRGVPMWHLEGTLDAHITLRSARDVVLANVDCRGYVYT